MMTTKLPESLVDVAVAATTLPMWVIYESPEDYHGKFVLRRWDAVGHETIASPIPIAVVGSLDDARAELPLGLENIGRGEGDDPVIVEVWI